MKDEIKQEITKVLTDLGIEIVKFVEDNDQNCSDPIRIWIENVPPNWNCVPNDDIEDPELISDQMPPSSMEEVDDELHTVLNKYLSIWEIVEMSGVDDGITGPDDYVWVLHGVLKD